MDNLNSIVNKFLGLLKDVLPLSPFKQFLDEFRNIPYLGYLNWFIPVGGMIRVMVAWLSAIVVFYLYMIVMRWVKMLGD